MREKLKNRKGFTLAELLIVVAIIAVLVAIMVPVFGTSRAKAVHAKDLANVRSKYAELVADKMGEADGFNATTGKMDIALNDIKAGITTSDVTETSGGDIEVSTPVPGSANITTTIDVDDSVNIT